MGNVRKISNSKICVHFIVSLILAMCSAFMALRILSDVYNLWHSALRRSLNCSLHP
jgi:hypothetical protein